MSKKKEIKMEGGMDVESAAAYLERIVKGMRDGTVQLERDANVLLLHPAGVVEMELEAQQKKDKEKIVIEVSWKRSDFAPGNNGEVVIK